MNFYNISFENKFNVECKRDDVSDIADLEVQYGIENDITEKWKEIVQEEDEIKRKKMIDDLISRLEKNKETNGFFSSEDVVHINKMNGFKIDDKEIYYLFFNTLREGFEKTKELTTGLVYRAIIRTLGKYFGKTRDNWRSLRMKLTEPDLDNDWEYPSISKQRQKGTGACVEQASVAHNLWLLCGVKSHYILTKDIQTDLVGSNNDGHAFCVVEYDDSFKLFDSTLGIYKVFDKLRDDDPDPIKLMREGKPFSVEADGKLTIYTSASKPLNL